MPRVLIGSIAESRVSISRAALLVKVTARTPAGLACPDWIRCAMRVVRTLVLPLPAPARMSAHSRGRVTACSCCGFRFWRYEADIGDKWGCVPSFSTIPGPSGPPKLSARAAADEKKGARMDAPNCLPQLLCLATERRDAWKDSGPAREVPRRFNAARPAPRKSTEWRHRAPRARPPSARAPAARRIAQRLRPAAHLPR